MSVEALNWVVKQRPRSAAMQSLLWTLANAADPEGVAFGWWKSGDHWWPYLQQVSRLSRGGLFNMLRELEELGLLQRDTVKPADGARPQPVIRLALDRVVTIVDEGKETERMVVHSTGATGESARPPVSEPVDSTTATEEGAAIPPDGLVHSTGATDPLYNPTSNPTTPKPPSSPVEAQQGRQGEKAASPSPSLTEPIGFNALCSSYPNPELIRRPKALAAFVALDEVSRRKAIDRAPGYAAACLSAHKKPVALHIWLRERGWEQVGAIARNAQSGPRVFVARNTPAYQAWAIVYGIVHMQGRPYIPPFLEGVGPRGERGAWVLAQVPAGGERWLVPFDQWVFLEAGTAQFFRYCERLQEIIGRSPTAYTPSGVQRTARLVARDGARWGDRPITGICVPLEWPPAKGEPRAAAPSATGPPPLGELTEEDDAEFIASTGGTIR